MSRLALYRNDSDAVLAYGPKDAAAIMLHDSGPEYAEDKTRGPWVLLASGDDVVEFLRPRRTVNRWIALRWRGSKRGQLHSFEYPDG